MGKWSEEGLPQDVFDQILNLCSLRDSIRVGLVCKSWHRVSKCNTSRRPQLPWLMPCNPNSKSAEEAGEENRCVYSLSDDTIYYDIKIPQIRGQTCCGSFISSDGWLLSIYHDLEVRLFHPWRRIHLKLPRLSNVSNVNVYDTSDSRIRKAAMSDDAAVVVVLTMSHNFAFCRSRRSRRRKGNIWILMFIHYESWYDDIIYHKGQFYAVRSNGAIGVLHINTRNPYVETLTGKVNFIPGQPRPVRTIRQCKTYLVPDSASEGIFIIKRIYGLKRIRTVHFVHGRHFHSTCDFQVYELGIEETTGTYKKTLVEVENLGDRVIFLGLNSSMIVMASKFPGFKGNCIYFTHDWGPPIFYQLSSESADMGIFNMEDRIFLPLFPNGAHPSFSVSTWIRPPSLVE